ncbi:T9SS type A sorting domain-containing protein [Rhodohalobacter sp. 8-1]|uniref:T9SS type A sorting domain-containing protein n=1 Tax=Rhodohalobacter sp. 8-1 TaxID=3131972 RepID=UPI0030ED4409
MKAQLLLIGLLISVLTTTAFSQDRSQSSIKALPDHPLLKILTTLDKASGPQKMYKTANDAFQLNTVEQQVRNEENWIPFQKTDNTYQSGNRVESNGYFTSELGGSWELDSREIYTYESDLLVSNVYLSIMENEPVSGDRTLITYQTSAGVTLPEVITYQYRDGGDEEPWVNEDRTTIQVDNGNIVGGTYEEWDIDSWTLVDRFTLEEINGDLVETTEMYDEFSESWINYEQYVYSNITASDLYEEFFSLIDQIDDGKSLYILSLLPDYTAYEWVEDGENGSWVATERQIKSPSDQLEYGATSAVMTSVEFSTGVPDEWMIAYQAIVGFDDSEVPTGLTFYSTFDEEESMELQMVFSEQYLYNNDNLLTEVLKFGSWDNFFFKAAQHMHATGRAVLTWSDVNTSIGTDELSLNFRLNPAYPNPFNPSTVIPFQTATAADVTIQVFDMLGRNVATLVDEFMTAGNHTVQFDASGLSSGVYLVRLNGAGVQQTRSVSLIK